MKRTDAAVSHPTGGSGDSFAATSLSRIDVRGEMVNSRLDRSRGTAAAHRSPESSTPPGARGLRHAAFTLIELLVVIAIIAIIAAILFPVFAQAREKAREITCISNTRQIGLQVRMYVQDFDETMPIFYAYNTQPPTGDPAHKGVEELILPYGKSKDLFRCPNDLGGPALSDPFYGCPGRDSYQSCYGSSYRFSKGSFSVIEGESLQNNFPESFTRIVTDAAFAAPAETRIIRDEMFPFFTMAKYGYFPDWYRQWHSRGGSVIFADGHARFTVSNGAFDQQIVCATGERSGDIDPSTGRMYYWGCD